MNNDANLPRTTDTALADLYEAASAATAKIASHGNTLQRMAGAEFYYRGKRRVTDMKVADAEAFVTAEVAKLEARRAATAESDENPWIGYVGKLAPHEQRGAERALAGIAEARAAVRAAHAAMEPLEALHAEHGWSRFFVVTSSPGHIHSSMSCSTCRPTTTFGWLPSLSGKTEAAAVEAHGPALCTVCFPTAPVEWVGGKLTASKAAKAAHH